MSRPLLATKGFWVRSRTGPTSERLHFAAVVSLVLLLLTWDAAFNGDERCEGVPSSAFWDDCVAPAMGGGTERLVALIAVMVAAALLLVSAILVVFASGTRSAERDRRKRAAAAVVLGCAVLGYAGYLGFVAWAWNAADGPGAPTQAEPPAAEAGRYLGLDVTPTILLVTAVALIFAAVPWGGRLPAARGRKAVSWTASAVLAILVLLPAVYRPDWWNADLVVPACLLLALVVAIVLHTDLRGRWTPTHLKTVGWRGFGAIVGMVSALIGAMVLSSLLVLGLAGYLGTDRAALATPPAYERFAVVLTLFVVVVVVVLGVALAVVFVRLPRLTLPELEPDDRGLRDEDGTSFAGGVARVDGTAKYAVAEPPDIVDRGRGRRLVVKRRLATLAHRGEAVLGWITIVAVVLLVALVVPVIRDWVDAATWPWLRDWVSDSSVAVLAASAALAAVAVAGHAARTAERPMALFWDIVSFFPRAGHPFAPPCYSERAVPELSGRIDAWLTAAEQVDSDATRPALADAEAYRRPGRSVVLAAHSMGTVIAAATIFALTDNDDPVASPAIRRIAFLSYGTQLRGFFSRFFPSVLGPLDLGVSGLLGPSLFKADPWTRQVKGEWSGGEPAAPEGWAATCPAAASPSVTEDERREYTLREVLGGGEGAELISREVRWISLWRRTDSLGFPVEGYRANGIDRGATERTPTSYLWSVAGHGHYLGTAQFLRARSDLIDRLRRANPDAAPEPEPAGRPARAPTATEATAGQPAR